MEGASIEKAVLCLTVLLQFDRSVGTKQAKLLRSVTVHENNSAGSSDRLSLGCDSRRSLFKNYAVTSYNGRYTISEQVISEELLEYGSEVLVWTLETILLKATGEDKTMGLWNVMVFFLLGYN